MRTFQQMADQAYAMRLKLLLEHKDPSEAEFPATKAELRAMGKRPWSDAPQATYGNRLYGLKLVLAS